MRAPNPFDVTEVPGWPNRGRAVVPGHPALRTPPTPPDPPPAGRKPRRSIASAKAAGRAFERLISDYLRDHLGSEHIDKAPRRGSDDRGDVAGVRTADGRRVVVECKDATPLAFPEWLRQAEAERVNDGATIGLVVAKRRGVGDPGQQYVMMTLDTLIALLRPTED